MHSGGYIVNDAEAMGWLVLGAAEHWSRLEVAQTNVIPI